LIPFLYILLLSG